MKLNKSLLSKIIGIIIICFVIVQCKDEFQRLILISTDTIKDISPITAKVTGTILDKGEGIKEYGHCWSTGEIPNIDDFKTNLGSKSDTGIYTSILENLDPSVKYYVRAYASDGGKTFYGKVKPFTTVSFTYPVVQTGSINNITTSSAKVSGNLIDLGNKIDAVSQHGHCWSLGNTPSISDYKTELGSRQNTGEFFSNLENLDDNETYYVRAYVIDGTTPYYGTIKPFTTQSFTIPVVQTGIVSDTTTTTATVSGNLISFGNGFDSVSQHGHCWSLGTNPTITDSKTELGSRSTLGEYSSPLAGLDDSTKYYFRAYAINDIGTAYGPVFSFTTRGNLPLVEGINVEKVSSSSVDITSNLVYLGADNSVTNYGHCWATHDNPTLADNSNDFGSTTSTGIYISSVSGLATGTVYYARSYATNSYGTKYGDVIQFVAGDPAMNFINDPNLVAYYPFTGNANDESTNNNNGTIVGATFVPDRFGNGNSALSFDGDGDKVSCGTSNRGITNTLTISLWVNTSDTYCYVISKYNLLQKDEGYLISVGQDGKIRIAGRDNGAGDYVFLQEEPPDIVNDSQWHHVLAEIVPNTWRIWLDGVLQGVATTPTTTPDLTNIIDLTIGSNPDIATVPAKEINGMIDDVLIFNRALSTEERNILSGSKR